jgi:hypothetical protein
MLDRTRPEPSRRGRAPPGCEAYKIDWTTLTPAQTKVVQLFAAALQEIRRNELELLRLGTVDYIRSMTDALRELNAEMRAKRLSHDT